MSTENERYQRGWEKLKEIDGEAGEKVINSLRDISPDLGRFIIEYSFGDIYARDGLDLKLKEIAVVAALTAMGTAYPQLNVHLNGALNVGCTINEVKEVILQMSSLCRFSRLYQCYECLEGVLRDRHERGIHDPLGIPQPMNLPTQPGMILVSLNYLN